MKPDFQPDGLPDYRTRFEHQVTWFQEWDIDQIFRQLATEEEIHQAQGDPSAAHSPDGGSGFAGNPLFKAPAYDSEPSGLDAGSVRLLSSTVTGNEYRPIYVLVIGEWETGWSWFMPFSPYTAPATDWELLTELEPQPLQILEIWNARSCPNDLLQRSWFVTRVKLPLVESAKALYGRMLGGGEEALEYLSTRIGTRVFEPKDPRLEYLTAEMELLDHLTGLAVQHENSEVHSEPVNIVPFVSNIPKREATLSLAAAGYSPDRELAFHSWQIEGTDVLVHLVELLGVPDGFTLRVEGDSSGMLEGAIVFDDEASKLGLIEEGCAGSKEVPLRFPANSLRIELSDGQSVKLVPTNS